jgi:hypothetical protein
MLTTSDSPCGTAPTADADAIITGWAVINRTQPDCVLIADQAGTVTGGGVIGLPPQRRASQDSLSRRDSLASNSGPHERSTHTVLAVQGGRLYRIS